MIEEQEVIERLKLDISAGEYSTTKTEVLETVLSMLKEKDIEIEYQKEKRNNQKCELAVLNEKQKDMNKLINDVKSYKGQFKRQEKQIRELQKENEEKDKQIDLMAEEIEKRDIEFTEYCEFKIVCDRNCKHCIEQYFKNKAINNGK